MSYPSTSPSPANLIADKSWRRRHSAWLLAPILGFGMLSFVGFLYVAIRVQTKKFWVAAAVGSTGSAVVWIVMALSGDLDETSGTGTTAATNSTDTTSDWGGGVALAVWAALLVYAVVLNRDYLRWRAGLTESKAWYNQHTPNTASGYGQAPAVGQPHVSPPGFLGVNQSDYYAASPAPGAPVTPPAPAYPTRPPQPPSAAAPRVDQAPPAQPSSPLDANSATADALARSLGVELGLASRVVAVRDKRGGFANVDDMVAAVGLQPHEFLKFRDRVTFGPRTSRPDVPPTTTKKAPTQDKPGGRILDI